MLISIEVPPFELDSRYRVVSIRPLIWERWEIILRFHPEIPHTYEALQGQGQHEKIQKAVTLAMMDLEYLLIKDTRERESHIRAIRAERQKAKESPHLPTADSLKLKL